MAILQRQGKQCFVPNIRSAWAVDCRARIMTMMLPVRPRGSVGAAPAVDCRAPSVRRAYQWHIIYILLYSIYMSSVDTQHKKGAADGRRPHAGPAPGQRSPLHDSDGPGPKSPGGRRLGQRRRRPGRPEVLLGPPARRPAYPGRQANSDHHHVVKGGSRPPSPSHGVLWPGQHYPAPAPPRSGADSEGARAVAGPSESESGGSGP